MTDADPMREGAEAIGRGDWSAARSAFERSLAIAETPEAWDGVASTCWWLDDVDALFGARERAFRLYRERGDDASAARVAIRIGDDTFLFRGDDAVANGWLERARSLL